MRARRIATIAIGVVTPLLLAAPALASTPTGNECTTVAGNTAASCYPNGQGVTATITIPSSLSLTLNSNTMPMPVSAGVAHGTVTYSVASNNAPGYEVAVTSPGWGNASLNTAVFAVTDTGAGGQTVANLSGAGAQVIADTSAMSASGGDAHSDAYSLTVPVALAPGAYSDTINYQLFAK
jgi:hypothetical protein